MSQITQPHDSFFRSFMTDITVAQAFLQAYLDPDLLAQCDMATLHLENASFITSDMRQRFSDILYALKAKDKDETFYAYMLIEHQHAPDKLMPFRMMEYQIAAMRRHLEQKRSKKLPVVVPILFYQGTKCPYPYSTNILDCFEQPELAQKVFPAQIRLIDLTVTPDEELSTHRHAAAFEMVMKDIYVRDIATILKKVLPLLVDYPHPVDKTKGLLQYLIEQGKCDDEQAFLHLLAESTPQYEEVMATLAQKFEQRGMQQGMQQGMQEGMQKGMQAALETTVANMLKKHMAVDLIESVTGVSQEKIADLAKKLQLH